MLLRMKYDGVSIPDPYTATDADAPLTLPITRGAYETLLRRLIVNGKPNVQFANGTVTGYAKAGDKIEGVKLRTAAGEKLVKGDFVIGM